MIKYIVIYLLLFVPVFNGLAQETKVENLFFSSGYFISENGDSEVLLGIPLAGLVSSSETTGEIGFLFGIEEKTAVEDASINNLAINVRPNPVISRSVISLNLKNAVEIDINIFDLFGNPVLNVFKGKISPGFNDFKFDGALLLPGSYFIRADFNSKSLIKKFIKL